MQCRLTKCCGERRKRGKLYLVFLRLHNHGMPKKCPKTAGEMTGKQGKIKQRFVRGAENEMGENRKVGCDLLQVCIGGAPVWGDRAYGVTF